MVSVTTPQALAGILITGFAKKRISFRVSRLARKYCLNSEDRKDLRQTFIMALLRAEGRFDPQRCNQNTFIWAVLDRTYKHLVRTLAGNDRRVASNPIAFDDVEPDCEYEILDPRGEDSLRQVDLQADVSSILTRMPAKLRRICELLMECSNPFEVSKRLGVAPSTVTRAIPRIKQYFVRAGFRVPA